MKKILLHFFKNWKIRVQKVIPKKTTNRAFLSLFSFLSLSFFLSHYSRVAFKWQSLPQTINRPQLPFFLLSLKTVAPLFFFNFRLPPPKKIPPSVESFLFLKASKTLFSSAFFHRSLHVGFF